MQIHRQKTIPSKKVDPADGGFTLLELMIVISLIGILASIIIAPIYKSKNSAYYNRSQQEFLTIANALSEYSSDYGGYPPDANRDLPPGLEQYLGAGSWPKAPYPNSVYDWENWAPGDLTADPKQQVYQISIRFCTGAYPGICTIPNEPWAAGFDYYSALYYCISGPCRSHSTQPVNHPGYCINC